MTRATRDLPAGTVTLLFTDIEGSTKLLHQLGPGAYSRALAKHRRTLRNAFALHNGIEVGTQGDSFFVAFADAREALAAAATAQQDLRSGAIRVRMGLHSGQPLVTDEEYVGLDVHRAARIAAAAHGNQILVSQKTRLLLGDDLTFLDLGEHRLKDFAEPVWLFQLGSESFPPLKTISSTNLPRPASSFIGREREVREIVALFRRQARLVSLTGPGGTGKTRLGIEAAAELVPDHRNGVLWVAFANLREPSLMAHTIGQVIGAKDGLAPHVGEREMMLLLDNFEQVVEAAPELSDLVETCPNLHVLVTSRERLSVRGEVNYEVPSLTEAEAVELFGVRARTQSDNTITELCRRLENLPLAIELAAARTRVMSPAQILARLSERMDLFKGGRDVEARQRTLRATMDWSYELLSPNEQRLLGRLSVFRGGCGLGAAERVADANLDALQSLVDKSLLRHREERFSMLETIREFAAERLEESGEANSVRTRHARHFCDMVEEIEPNLRTGAVEWLELVAQDHENIRAALDFLTFARDTQAALRLAGAVSRFWYLRGYLHEGSQWLDAALRADTSATTARAKALNGAAVMAYNLGDFALAKYDAEEALTLHREFGDRWAAAYSTLLLGNIASDSGDPKRSLELFDESSRAFRELGDELYALTALANSAWSHRQLGEAEEARELNEEALASARRLGEESIESYALCHLALYYLDQGRLDGAPAMARQSLQISHKLGNVQHLGLALRVLAYALALDGKPAIAARLLTKGVAVLEEIGSTDWMPELNQKTLAHIRTRLDESELADATERGRAMTLEEAVAMALASGD